MSPNSQLKKQHKKGRFLSQQQQSTQQDQENMTLSPHPNVIQSDVSTPPSPWDASKSLIVSAKRISGSFLRSRKLMKKKSKQRRNVQTSSKKTEENNNESSLVEVLNESSEYDPFEISAEEGKVNSSAHSQPNCEILQCGNSAEEDDDIENDEEDKEEETFGFFVQSLPPSHPQTPSAEKTRFYWELCYGSTKPQIGTPGIWSANRAPPVKSCLSSQKKINILSGSSHTPPEQIRTTVHFNAHFNAASTSGAVFAKTPMPTYRREAKELEFKTTATEAAHTPRKFVKFGDVAAAEFDFERPTVELTPMASAVAKLKYSVEEKVEPEEDQELTKETIENTALLDCWEDAFDLEMDEDEDEEGLYPPIQSSCTLSFSDSPYLKKTRSKKKKKQRHSSIGRRNSSSRRGSSFFVKGGKNLLEETLEDEGERSDSGVQMELSNDEIEADDSININSNDEMENCFITSQTPDEKDIMEGNQYANFEDLFHNDVKSNVTRRPSADGISLRTSRSSGSSDAFHSPLAIGEQHNRRAIHDIPDSLHSLNSSGARSSPASVSSAASSDISKEEALNVHDIKVDLEPNLALFRETPLRDLVYQQEFHHSILEEDEFDAEILAYDSNFQLDKDIEMLLVNMARRKSLIRCTQLHHEKSTAKIVSVKDLIKIARIPDLFFLAQKCFKNEGPGNCNSVCHSSFLDAIEIAESNLAFFALKKEIGRTVEEATLEANANSERKEEGDISLSIDGNSLIQQLKRSLQSSQLSSDYSSPLFPSPGGISSHCSSTESFSSSIMENVQDLADAVAKVVVREWVHWERQLTHVLMTRLTTLKEICNGELLKCEQCLGQNVEIITSLYPSMEDKRNKAKIQVLKRKRKRIARKLKKEKKRIEELKLATNRATVELESLSADRELASQLYSVKKYALTSVETQERCCTLTGLIPFSTETLAFDEIEIRFSHMNEAHTCVSWKMGLSNGNYDVICDDSNLSLNSDESAELATSVPTMRWLESPERAMEQEETVAMQFIQALLRKEKQVRADWMKTIGLLTERPQSDLSCSVLGMSDLLNRANMAGLDVCVVENDFKCEVNIVDSHDGETIELQVEIVLEASSLLLIFCYDRSDHRNIVYSLPSKVHLVALYGEPPVNIQVLQDSVYQVRHRRKYCNAFLLKQSCEAVVDACKIGL